MIVWLRLVKLLFVMVLAAGTVGAFLPRALEDRQRAAYWLGGAGFFGTWITGVLLVTLTERSLLAGWVIGSAALSMVSIQVVLFSVGKDGRRTPVAAAIAIVTLLGTLALMVLRP